MAAYVIANVDVKDAALFEQYRKQVPETIARHGGKYLVRGGTHQRLGTTRKTTASRRRSA